MQSSTKIALVANSNPLSTADITVVKKLISLLEQQKITVVTSPKLLTTAMVPPQMKADYLQKFFLDNTVSAIADVSGGDLANGILPYLDYRVLQQYVKPFYGYSDLTTVMNALIAKAQHTPSWCQLKTLIWDETGEQAAHFFTAKSFWQPRWQFIQGHNMQGQVIGGNLRCFLKLAGTPYLPDFSGKILFLESHGGDTYQLLTGWQQLKQLPHFDQLAGVLLGTFTTYEKNHSPQELAELFRATLANPNLPVAQTAKVGHGKTAKGLTLGQVLHLEK